MTKILQIKSHRSKFLNIPYSLNCGRTTFHSKVYFVLLPLVLHITECDEDSCQVNATMPVSPPSPMFQRLGKTDTYDLSFLRHGTELPEWSGNQQLFDRADKVPLERGIMKRWTVRKVRGKKKGENLTK